MNVEFSWRDCTIVLEAILGGDSPRWRFRVASGELRERGEATSYEAARRAAIACAEQLAAHRDALKRYPPEPERRSGL